MKSPERKSRTSDCAPNPSAMPAIPAPASSGARFTPSSLEHREHRDRPDQRRRRRCAARPRWSRPAACGAPATSVRCRRAPCPSTDREATTRASPPRRCSCRTSRSTMCARDDHAGSMRRGGSRRCGVGFDSASATSAALVLPVIRYTVEHSHDCSPFGPQASIKPGSFAPRRSRHSAMRRQDAVSTTTPQPVRLTAR